MAATLCPNCNMLLTPIEVKRGNCPSCNGELSAPAAKSSRRTPSVQRDSAPVGGRAGRCELSGETSDNIQTRYVTATTFSPLGLLFPLIMLITRKQVCIAIRVSEESYRKVRSIHWKPALLLLAWLFLGFPLAITGMVVVGKSVPMLAAAIGLLFFAMLPALLIGMGPYRRRHLDALINDSLNGRLQSQMKGRRWGLSTMMIVGKKAPRGLTAVPVSSL